MSRPSMPANDNAGNTPPLQKSSIHNVVVGSNDAQASYNPFDHVRLPDERPRNRTMVEGNREVTADQLMVGGALDQVQ